jgi:hypothetical protein
LPRNSKCNLSWSFTVWKVCKWRYDQNCPYFGFFILCVNWFCKYSTQIGWYDWLSLMCIICSVTTSTRVKLLVYI